MTEENWKQDIEKRIWETREDEVLHRRDVEKALLLAEEHLIPKESMSVAEIVDAHKRKKIPSIWVFCSPKQLSNLKAVIEGQEKTIKGCDKTISELMEMDKKLRKGYVVERIKNGKYEIIECLQCQRFRKTLEELEKEGWTLYDGNDIRSLDDLSKETKK